MTRTVFTLAVLAALVAPASAQEPSKAQMLDALFTLSVIAVQADEVCPDATLNRRGLARLVVAMGFGDEDLQPHKDKLETASARVTQQIGNMGALRWCKVMRGITEYNSPLTTVVFWK